MWGDKYMTAFLLGNIISAVACRFFKIGTTPLLTAILLLITISTYLQFNKKRRANHTKSVNINIHLTIALLTLLGAVNYTRAINYNTHNSPTAKSYAKEYISAKRERIILKFISRSSLIITEKEDLATIMAFTAGNKGLMQKETINYYKNSGAMHILALSGLHIGIIYGLVNRLLFFLNFTYFSRQIKFIICSCMIFIYSAIGGFSASITRAAIMILVHQLLKIYRRSSGRWTSWLCSSNIILLFSPHSIKGIGFQLSFAATAGIIALYPTIKYAYRGPKALRRIWELAGVSVACQIATLPLVLYYFNTFPMYFLITNLIAIPLVTISIYTFTIAYITFKIPIIGEVTSSLAAFAIKMLNRIIEFIGC